MANDNVIITEADKEAKSITINHIRLMSVDRSTKDIKDYKDALESAESVYYPVRSMLYNIYKRIELDGVFTGTWEKRMSGVLNKKLRYVDKEGRKVDEMDSLINSKDFRMVMQKMMESITHGITGIEFIPGPAFAFVEIPRQHIFPHKRYIGQDEFSNEGISYDDMPNILVIGGKDDLGMLVKIAPYVLWKQNNYADWVRFVEIYGHPFRIFEYDVFDKKTKEEAIKLNKEAGSSLGMVIPKQLNFRMEDGKTANANGDLQDRLRQAMNEEIMLIVLGVTETTTSSQSSGYAQSKEHGNQQRQITISDMVRMNNWLNDTQYIRILQSYNYPVVEGGRFEFEEEADLEALKSEKEIDYFLINTAKLPLDDDYLYKKYGRPKPANYNELKKAMEEKQKQPAAPPAPGGSDPVRSEKKGKKLSAWYQKLSDFFAEAR